MGNVTADIESICGKCGDVWHVVVAKVGERIVQVQCKQCGGLHRFRPPGSASKRSPAGRAAAADKPGAARKRPSSHSPLVEADESLPIRPYRANEAFRLAERIEHATFGQGVVEILIPPNKIQVFFPGGRRILVHGPAAAI
jgi:hypothetical protein